MLNTLKSLALASTIALSSAFTLTPEPANAGTCWYVPSTGEEVSGSYCRTSLRYIDGLRTWFVTDGNGALHRFVFYTDGTVTHFSGQYTNEFEWDRDSDGSYRIFWNDGTEFIFFPD